MKNRLLCLLLAFLALGACRKNTTTSQSSSSQVLVDQARAGFIDSILVKTGNFANYRAGFHKAPLWDEASITETPSEKIVWAPIWYSQDLVVASNFGGKHYFGLNNFTWLRVSKDNGSRWHFEVVTDFPDSNYISHPINQSEGDNFSGIRFVEDWWGNLIEKHLCQGNQVKVYKPIYSPKKTDIFYRVCYDIEGYNYSEGAMDGVYFWTESGSCYDLFTYEPVIDGGGSGYTDPHSGSINSRPGAALTHSIVIRNPTNIIKDIRQYFGCFYSNPSFSYKVSVCVDQPVPSKRTPWAFSVYNKASGYSNFIDPGHVFLVLTQNTPWGIVSRNVGFYPNGVVTPFSPSSPGILNDDELHKYNISGTFQVSGDMFMNIIAFVSHGNDAGVSYDLNTNNCTTFIINALGSGHVFLPSTIGGWLGGVGNDPGDLGEDIRTHDFSGMVRSTTETAHLNVGNCN